MATYIGYYRPDPENVREQNARARETGEPAFSETMRKKVVDLRNNLPEGLKLIGSWASMSQSPEHPSVWIAETDDPRDLQFVNRWYQGFLVFDWVPANPVGTTARQAQAATRQAQGR